MAASTLHIVFNPSAAAGLREALRQAGRGERVVGLFDCLSFGPINPPDPELRRKWVEEELGYTGWEEVVGEATSFWSEALSIGNRRIAWLSRRSAQEYAGFLEWLWRLGEEPTEVVDLTDVMVAGNDNGTTKPHLAMSLGLLPPHKILGATCSTARKNLLRSCAFSTENYGDVLKPKTRHCVPSAKVNLHPRRCRFSIACCCRAQHLNGKRRRRRLDMRSGNPRPYRSKPPIWSCARVPARSPALACWNPVEICPTFKIASCGCRAARRVE